MNRNFPYLVELPSVRERICRCGAQIGPRGTIEVVAGLPRDLTIFFDGLAFCSECCVRAQFLETLSVLDGLDTPNGEAIIPDLRFTYVRLAAAYAAVLHEWDSGESQNAL
jgi:hypothetical protein